MLGVVLGKPTNDSVDEGKRNMKYALGLASTIELSAPDKDEFFGACIDSGAQVTLIVIFQAKAYC